MLNYLEKYQKEVKPALKKEFGFKNDHAVLKIVKVVINCGIGKMLINNSSNSKELLTKIEEDLKMITGQKPVLRMAKKSISNFKLREGMPVGLVVTLRGKRMADFIDRFINIALPRTRDFWGISLKSFDERGNLNFGVKEQMVFPEISAESAAKPFSFEVSFVTNAKQPEQAKRLFKLLGFPLKKE